MSYTPAGNVQDPQVAAELLQVSRAMTELSERLETKTHVAPDKPQLGMVRYADGVNWNPGAGEGSYIYTSAGWTLMGSSDFYLNVAKGNVTGHSLVHKFGRNDAVANGSWEMITLLSSARAFLSAATTVRVKAGGDAADTAAGAGAQGITIEGLDATGATISETVATAGASASAATTASFLRVFRAYVSASGTYGAANTAAVVIENSGGGTDLIMIAVEEGQTQYAAYTIPLGKTGYLLSVFLTVDSNKTADFKLLTRANVTDTSDPMSPVRLKNYWDGLSHPITFKPASPALVLPALTDVWIEAQGSGAVAEVSADFEILLVDD